MPGTLCNACVLRADTLAQYRPDTFEALAFEQTVEKLISDFGYPAAELRAVQFDPSYMMRGLIIDKVGPWKATQACSCTPLRTAAGRGRTLSHAGGVAAQSAGCRD
jgi:hypothetical protein